LRCPRAGVRRFCSRAARASSCRHNDRRVRCSLHWDCFGAGNARGRREVSAPRLGRPFRIERSGLSWKAWPDAAPWGPAVSLARAAVERRQASAPCAGCALRREVKQVRPRLSAFYFLFVFSVLSFVRAPYAIVTPFGPSTPERLRRRSPCGVVLGNGLPHDSGAIKKRIARTRSYGFRPDDRTALAGRWLPPPGQIAGAAAKRFE
jgi:hypothetical protein